MPSPRSATLDVRNFSSSDPGWKNVIASNGQTYSYCYTGGDDGAGGMRVIVGKGTVTLNVRLIANNRYRMSNCAFVGTGANQMSAQVGNQATTITDKNDGVASVKYTITVTDTGNGNCTIACDPQIDNELPPT